MQRLLLCLTLQIPRHVKGNYLLMPNQLNCSEAGRLSMVKSGVGERGVFRTLTGDFRGMIILLFCFLNIALGDVLISFSMEMV